MKLVAFGFLAGCVTLLMLSGLPALGFAVILPVAIYLLFRFWHLRLPAAFFAGFSWALIHAAFALSPALDEAMEGKDILLEAEVTSLPERFENKTRFLISPTKVLLPDSGIKLPDKIRVSWYQSAPEIRAGEQWRFKLRLKKPRGFANPGGFDYEKWLFSQRIQATGYVREVETAEKLKSAPLSVNQFRNQLAVKLATELTQLPSAGLISALALGIKSDLSADSWDRLIHTGTNHLVAISGLHIGLVATLSFWLMNFLWRRSSWFCLKLPAQKAAAIFSLIPAAFYAMLAGFSIPTQRALIMLTVVVAAVLLLRRIRAAEVLSLALLAVLIFDPLAVLSAGFWLSFAAVMVILWSVTNTVPSKIPQVIKIQFSLILALAPMTLWFFSQSSVIAPVANLIAVPVVGLLAVPILLSGLILLFIYEPLGWFLIYSAEKLLSWLTILLEFLANLPFSHWQHALPHPAVFLLALFSVTLLLTFRGAPGRWLGLILLLPIVLIKSGSIKSDEFEITVMDVGQGLSTVVRTQNHTLVYDTGQHYSDRFNSADAVILPYLRQTAVKQIDMLVLSHADSDHAGSAEALNEGIKIKKTLSSFPLNTATLTGSPCLAGQTWEWDGIKFEVLHPSKNWQGSENNSSCVIAVENHAGRALLTGDIETSAENYLVKKYSTALTSHLMLVPHHGSKTSSSLEFIKTVAPKSVVYTVGYRNRWGFPKQEVVARYDENKIDQFRTDRDGAIKFLFSPDHGVTVEQYRQKHQRIW